MAYHISKENVITIFAADGSQVVVAPAHANYGEVKKLLIQRAPMEKVIEALNKTLETNLMKVIEKKADLKGYTLSADGTAILLNGAPVHNSLTQRALELKKQGFPLDPFLKFLDNLSQNPSNRAVQELYDFLDRKALPLTEDGHFLAYKAIRPNYLDIYSGTINNRPGQVVEFERNKVDDDRQNECSHGLHVGGSNYVRWYGRHDSKIVVVKVNPRDCVSVPQDHNAEKLRVCRYEVLSEVPDRNSFELESAAYTSDGNSWSLEEEYENDLEDVFVDESWDFDEVEECLATCSRLSLSKIADKVGEDFEELTETTSVAEVRELLAWRVLDLQEDNPELFDEIVMLYF